MVLQAYLREAKKDPNTHKTFVYISAEDIFRPVIPARYITTKREAEENIANLCEASGHNVRPVFIRPSTCFLLSYHFEAVGGLTNGVMQAWCTTHICGPLQAHWRLSCPRLRISTRELALWYP